MHRRLYVQTHRTVLAIGLLTTFTQVARAQTLPVPPSPKHLLVRVSTEPEDIQSLYDWGLDVWEVEPTGAYADVRLSADELDLLRRAGFAVIVWDENVYATVAEREAAFASDEVPWSAYHEPDEAVQFMNDLAADHPSRVTLSVIGYSYEGRPIYALRIRGETSEPTPEGPAFFIVGCHHAREWISVEAPLYIADRLANDYASDPRVRRLLNRGEVWIVPILNPDGFAYSHAADRLWRLNRRSFMETEAVGVDLNRNYGYQWGRDLGSSAEKGTETYRGAAPFSESETRAIRDLFASRRFIGAISFHNYGQVVLTPWAYTYSPPQDGPAMRALGGEVADRMNAEHEDPRYDYDEGQWASALYVASGVFEDWVYGEHGVLAVLIELRPRTTPYFLLPPDEILPTCIEAYAGALTMMERTFGIHDGPPGDLNASTVVDLADAALLISCLSGGPAGRFPGFPLGCHGADLNRDGHGDLHDFASFQNGFGARRGHWPLDPGDADRSD